MIIPIKRGAKVCGPATIAKIRELDEEFLVKLWFHTSDRIQEVLIEEICRLKGYNVPGESVTDPDIPPKRFA